MGAITENRPYTFELAALALGGQDLDSVRNTALSNGIRVDYLDRAPGILRTLQRGGEDPQDFILREYILDGWLRGYLPLSVQAGVRLDWALAYTPHTSRCDEIRAGYRRHAVGSHTLYYRITNGDLIDVVRVLHKRINVERHLD